MALSVGAQAPDFVLKSKTDSGLSDVRLSDQKGKKNVVLLFFPAAFTSVCEQELCEISGGFSQYSGLDAVVYGISVDSPFAQEAWAKQAGITIPLLSDYDHKTVRAYDVELPDLLGLGPGSKRAVFVIDKQGVIRYSEATPTPHDLPDFEKVREALRNC